MGRFAAVELEDENYGDHYKWAGIPNLWLNIHGDHIECWYPNNDAWFKAENEIIFNRCPQGWHLRRIRKIDNINYRTLNKADERAHLLNRQDCEDKRYDVINKNLDRLDDNYRILLKNQEKIVKNFEEMIKLLKAPKNQENKNNKDVSSLGALLPIKDPKGLKTFEKLFMTESWISQALKELVIILTDDQNINESIPKILGAVFSNQLAAKCSWNVKNGIKVKDSSIIKKIYVTLKEIDAAYDGFETAAASWFQNKKKSTMTPD
ncbi:uncharacterized protein LOC130662892 [Microplitis mediator]|uniref:uncharacterized protein LOC130662892 n=1 Tax=Microplitis mediator TaxID=375433 RepID=UPI002555FE59|nr:uncharacterized protein LOC130662892 [Microplitis mediator]XP_057317830.1 uncharacterized protein LOC130662892 [Microplitis mediator]